MSNPLVSCIMPVFNGEAYLREALESVLAQGWRPLEVIVVDDGSTDGTAALMAKYGPPVRYVRQANAGPAAARNRGVALAQGEFISFLDADDLWRPDRIERQMSPLLEDPGLMFTVCHIQNFWAPGLEAEEAARKETRDGRPAAGYLMTGMVARRSAFDVVGALDQGLRCADSTEWMLRAREAGLRDYLISEVLVFRRIHGHNLTTSESDASQDEFLDLLKRRLDQRRAGGQGDSAR